MWIKNLCAMIIEIKDGIEFDTEKSFEEQSFECQNYFYDTMNDNTPNVTYDDFNRPLVETWALDGAMSDYVIERVSKYKSQEYDWHLQSQIIKIVEL